MDCLWKNFDVAMAYQGIMDNRTEILLLKDKLNNETFGLQALRNRLDEIHSELLNCVNNTFCLPDMFLRTDYQGVWNFYNTVGIVLRSLFPDYSYSNVNYNSCSYKVLEFEFYSEGYGHGEINIIETTERREFLADKLLDEIYQPNTSQYCYYWIKFYFCIPLKSGLSDSFKESLIKLILKDIVINQHTNFLCQGDIAKTHSKEFLNHLLDKAREE